VTKKRGVENQPNHQCIASAEVLATPGTAVIPGSVGSVAFNASSETQHLASDFQHIYDAHWNNVIYFTQSTDAKNCIQHAIITVFNVERLAQTVDRTTVIPSVG